ncbi:hypothetical protein PENTCL1PPCAC_30020, partial [Pristionchus entomophagus]
MMMMGDSSEVVAVSENTYMIEEGIVPVMSEMTMMMSMCVMYAEESSSHLGNFLVADAVALKDTSNESMSESGSLACDPSLLESETNSEFLAENHAVVVTTTGSVNHADNVSSSLSVNESVVVSDLLALVQSESCSCVLSVMESMVVSGVLSLGESNSETLQDRSKAVALEPFGSEE